MNTKEYWIEEAREWLKEQFPDEEERIEYASDKCIIKNIENHYGGGFECFIEDGKVYY